MTETETESDTVTETETVTVFTCTRRSDRTPATGFRTPDTETRIPDTDAGFTWTQSCRQAPVFNRFTVNEKDEHRNIAV